MTSAGNGCRHGAGGHQKQSGETIIVPSVLNKFINFDRLTLVSKHLLQERLDRYG
jgi:hypothetical protein